MTSPPCPGGDRIRARQLHVALAGREGACRLDETVRATHLLYMCKARCCSRCCQTHAMDSARTAKDGSPKVLYFKEGGQLHGYPHRTLLNALERRRGANEKREKSLVWPCACCLLISPYCRGGWRRRRRRGRTERPKNGVREHCTANCNEGTSAVVSAVAWAPTHARCVRRMRCEPLNARSLPASSSGVGVAWPCMHAHSLLQRARQVGNAMRCEETRGEREKSEAKGGEEAGGSGSASSSSSSSSSSSPRSRGTANHATPSLALAPGTRGFIKLHVRQPWRVPSRSCCFAQQPPASPRRTSGKLLGLCIHHRGVVQ